ncbi:MAG: hypothetical protein J7L99_03880 [Planctomycetes bacterium]|nr:hypothetical protein [Planctomycetota bacterium]
MLGYRWQTGPPTRNSQADKPECKVNLPKYWQVNVNKAKDLTAIIPRI